MAVEYLIVFILAILSGAWSTAAGVFMELNPLGVFLAATAGSIAFTAIVLFGAGPWRDRFFARYFPDAEDRVAASPIGHVLEKWGIPGLAFSSILFGPTLTLSAVLMLGLDRKRFFILYVIVGVVGFALSTAFWSMIAA